MEFESVLDLGRSVCCSKHLTRLHLLLSAIDLQNLLRSMNLSKFIFPIEHGFL